MRQSVEIEIIGVEVFDRPASGALDLHFAEGQLDRPDNASGNLVLELENVLQVPIEPFRPQVGAGRGVDHLASNAHPGSRPADPTFQHEAHTDLLGHLAYV